MATYVFPRCPHCRKFFAQRFENEYRHGSPLQHCPYCHKIYWDKDYHEVEIDGFYRTDKIRSFGWFGLFVFWTPFCFAKLLTEYIFPVPRGFITNISDESLIACTVLSVLFLILSIWRIIIDYKKNTKEMQEELIKSQKRLSDPEYALTLKALGYNVPLKYLPIDHQYINGLDEMEKSLIEDYERFKNSQDSFID